jgi:hypothetical protein
MRAIVLERNKMVNRRLVRYLTCAGLEAVAVEDPKDVEQHLPTADVLAADAFDGDLMMNAIRANPKLRGLLWTAEPLHRSLRYVVETPQVSNLLGRRDFESTPRPWELLMAARRLLRPDEPGPPFAAFLDWGFVGFQESIAGTAARDAAVDKVQRFINHLGVPKRISELYGELAHEMLMNALYDAPVDARGTPKYAQDRKAVLSLPPPEQPTLRLAADGSNLAIQVIDPFGRLERHHVFGGLARGLAGGEMDQSHGGAGLGMVVCHNATVAMFFDVVRGKKTEVTGIFELDMNLREFRTHAKSVHYFQV